MGGNRGLIQHNLANIRTYASLKALCSPNLPSDQSSGFSVWPSMSINQSGYYNRLITTSASCPNYWNNSEFGSIYLPFVLLACKNFEKKSIIGIAILALSVSTSVNERLTILCTI
jgi:hypothetical protein